MRASYAHELLKVLQGRPYWAPVSLELMTSVKIPQSENLSAVCLLFVPFEVNLHFDSQNADRARRGLSKD